MRQNLAVSKVSFARFLRFIKDT